MNASSSGAKRQRVDQDGEQKRPGDCQSRNPTRVEQAGQKRPAAGGDPSTSSDTTSISILTYPDHATELLARVDDLRRSNPGLCDLLLRPGGEEGEGHTSGAADILAHSAILAAASPYVLFELNKQDRHGRFGGGSGGGSGSSAASSFSSSSSSSSSSPSSTSADQDDLAAEIKALKAENKALKAENGALKAPPPTTTTTPTSVTLTIPGLGASVLNAAVHFAYHGSMALDADSKADALPLLAGFQRLEMGGAVEMVAEWVGACLDPSSALSVWRTAEMLHMGRLKAQAIEYVDTHFDAVTTTEEWRMLSAAGVEAVLTRDALRPGGEINVFHALVRWGRGGVEGTSSGKEGAGNGRGAASDAGGGGGESKDSMAEDASVTTSPSSASAFDFAFEDDNEELAAMVAAADKDRARTVPAPAIGVDGATESGRAAQFADLLGRCVRASLLGSDELTSIV